MALTSFVTETWLSAQGDEAKTIELAPSGFDVKSFPRQSLSLGGGIATVYKSTLGSNITFKTNFDFTHTSFEVVEASITLQHNTLHFFCLYRPPPKRRNYLTDSMFTEQLHDLLDYVNNLPGFSCLFGDMNIHFDNPLQSLTTHNSSPWFESIRDDLFIAKRKRCQAERKWRNTKLTIFKDLYRQAKHKVSKLVHSAKCKFYTERLALASSSKELHEIVNILSNRHPPKILPNIYPSATFPVFSSNTLPTK